MTGLLRDHAVVKEGNMGSFGAMFNSKNLFGNSRDDMSLRAFPRVLGLLSKHRDVGTSMATLSIAIII